MAKSANIEQNIARMKPNEFLDTFTPLFANCKAGTELPAIMIWGPPGVSKSACVNQLAERVGKLTNKQTFVHDVRLININPIDLRGIPSKVTITQKIKKPVKSGDKIIYKQIDEQVDVARWLRPEIFQMDDSDDVINFLFLDEITAAPQSVQAAAYQLTLDRKVGEHKLPDNVFVLCCGNRISDRAIASKLSTALANRLLHIEFYPDIDDWKKWALNNNIDMRIVGFLNWKPELLFKFDPTSDDIAFPTPRTWEMASNILKKVKDIKIAQALIAGCVGIGTAIEFSGYAKVYHALPNVDSIFEGKNIEYPTKMDIAYALSSSLVNRANKATKKQLDNMIKWLIGWRTDYAILTVKDCIKSDRLMDMFAQSDIWVDWYVKNKDIVSSYGGMS